MTTGTRAAQRYAKALLEVAVQNNSLENIYADMQIIDRTMEDSHELKLFLQNPVIKSDKKINALKEIFPNLQSGTFNLFNVLLENKRLDILPAIAQKFLINYNEYKGVQVAHVTTATPLSPEMEQKILDKIKQLSNKTDIQLVKEVNPDIIGGFIIRIGDKQYNASLANQLNQIKREFIN